MAIFLSILSAALYGAADFLCGLSARTFPTLTVLLLSQGAGGVLALILAPMVGSGMPAFSDLVWGALAGLSGLGGLACLYTGLARGRVAIVSPVSALVSAIIPAVYGALTGERPGPTALAGAALCLPAILLLAWEGDDAGPSLPAGENSAGNRTTVRPGYSIIIGAAAGLLLGAFYIFISKCGNESGLWPLAGARIASLGVLGLFFLLKKTIADKKDAPEEKSGAGSRLRKRAVTGTVTVSLVAASLMGGFFDFSANLAFLYASRTGLLMIVSVVTSLYPAPTVFLARIFLKERLPPRRMAGIVLALAGIVLVGLKV